MKKNSNQILLNLLKLILYFFICNHLNLSNFVKQVTSINQNTLGNTNNIVNNDNKINKFNKECTEIQTCAECSFKELRTLTECSITGNIKIKRCEFYDFENTLKDTSVSVEHCDNLHFKINSIQKLILFFVVLFVICFIIRRKEKIKIYGSIHNKYKIIKNK